MSILKINGDEYASLSTVAKQSGVNIRTLSRWIEKGDLSNFMTTFQDKKGRRYFRVGLPKKSDVYIEGTHNEYYLPEKDGD